MRNTRLRVFDSSLINNHAHSLAFQVGEFVFKHNKATHLRVAGKGNIYCCFQNRLTWIRLSTLYVYPTWLRKSVRNFMWISRFSSILASAITLSTICFFNRNTWCFPPMFESWNWSIQPSLVLVSYMLFHLLFHVTLCEIILCPLDGCQPALHLQILIV